MCVRMVSVTKGSLVHVSVRMVSVMQGSLVLVSVQMVSVTKGSLVHVSVRMVSVMKGSLVLVSVWMVSTMKENVVLVSRFSWVMVSSPSPTRSPRAHPTSCRSCPTCWPTWRRRSPLFSWGQRWVSDLYCVPILYTGVVLPVGPPGGEDPLCSAGGRGGYLTCAVYLYYIQVLSYLLGI